MKNNSRFKRLMVCLAMVLCGIISVSAQSRRPIDNKHPMWLIHIDVWNNADPQKIIDLIPEDIKPYVCLNLSLSCSYDTSLKMYKKPQNAIQTYRSWASVCCRNNMFFVCQPASGGHTHIRDNAENFDKALEIHEQFFKDYPNFLGWNYAEQFWGFNEANDESSSSDVDRIKLFAKLVPMHHKYGGMLTISFCGNIWSHPLNPIGMMKRNNDFLEACKSYPEAILWLYKYTTSANWYNNESVTIGPFISGLAKNYGVRYDNCGWNGAIEEFTKEGNEFNGDGLPTTYPGAVGIAPVMEQTALNGACVWDGPELIWTECFKSEYNSTVDGYSRRRWSKYPNFDNIWIDMFRKVIDGTIHIPSRQEVIARTKVVMKNDVTASDDPTGLKIHAYAAPIDFYHDLYWQKDPFNSRVSNESGIGNVEGYANNNFLYFKKTGRYSTIPIVIDYYDNDAKNAGFYTIKRSDYNNNTNNVHTNKVSIFNQQYPDAVIEEGDLFVGRHKNALVCYYPFSDRKKNDDGTYKTTSYAKVPFKYNTCSNMELTFGVFSSAHVKEYADHLDFYFNNYRNDVSDGAKTDVVKINGASSKPSYTVVSNRCSATVSESWSNNVYTLSVKHNGPVDIRINCAGNNGRDASLAMVDDNAINASSIKQPDANSLKYQPLVIEAEDFDFKNVSSCVTDAFNSSYRNVLGHSDMGFVNMGTNTQAELKYTGKAIHTANHKISIKYLAKEAGSLKVTVNGTSKTLTYNSNCTSFDGQDSWAYVTLESQLNESSDNTILITNAGGKELLIDNVTFDPQDGDPSEVSPSSIEPGNAIGNAKYDSSNGHYIFYTPSYSSFEFTQFNGKKVSECAELTINCGAESTIGYRLDLRVKKSDGTYFTESINGQETEKEAPFLIGSETAGTRMANATQSKSFDLQTILKDYLAIDPNCTLETVRLNTVVAWGAEDADKTGKYFLTLSELYITQGTLTATGKSLTNLYDLQMYSSGNAIDADKKALDGTTVYEAGTEIYGKNANVHYLTYTDLSAYSTMIIEGEGNLRVLLNRTTDGGTVAQGNLVEINPTFKDGVATIDLSQYSFAHLHSIKVSFGSTARLSSIKLYNAYSDFADYHLVGAGKNEQSAIDALADANATSIALYEMTNQAEVKFESANPNCMFYKETKNITSSEMKNVVTKSGNTYSANKIEIVDGRPFFANVDIAVPLATYTRFASASGSSSNSNLRLSRIAPLAETNSTLAASTTEWVAVALPFEMSTSDNITLYTLNTVNETTANFQPVTNATVPAGTVVLYKRSDSEDIVLTGQNIVKTTEDLNIQPTGVDGWYTAYTFVTKTITDVSQDEELKNYNVYTLENGNLVLVAKELTLEPFRTLFLTNKSTGTTAAESYSISDLKELHLQDDGTEFTNNAKQEYDVLTYSRTFSKANIWYSLYLPFSIDVEDYKDEFDIAEIYAFSVYRDTNGDGEINAEDESQLIVFPYKTGTTTPNLPYLIRPKTAKTITISSNDNVLYPAEDGYVTCATTKVNYTVTGLNKSLVCKANDGNYYMALNGTLSHITAADKTTTVKPYRWILKPEARTDNYEQVINNVNEIKIVVIGEDENINATGIKDVEAGKTTDRIYRLDGRMVQPGETLSKGIYIINGKKVFVKE